MSKRVPDKLIEICETIPALRRLDSFAEALKDFAKEVTAWRQEKASADEAHHKACESIWKEKQALKAKRRKRPRLTTRAWSAPAGWEFLKRESHRARGVDVAGYFPPEAVKWTTLTKPWNPGKSRESSLPAKVASLAFLYDTVMGGSLLTEWLDQEPEESEQTREYREAMRDFCADFRWTVESDVGNEDWPEDDDPINWDPEWVAKLRVYAADVAAAFGGAEHPKPTDAAHAASDTRRRGADKAKDAEARGVEAFTKFLRHILNYVEDLAGVLQCAVSPTYPFDAADGGLVKRNCAVLRRLLTAVIPSPGPLDLDALSGYPVEPKTLLTFFAVSSNRDAQHAAKWLLSLVERIDRDVTTEQRPTEELVQELEDAAALLRNSIPQEAADVRRRSVPLSRRPGRAEKERWNMPKPKGRAAKARELIEAVDALERLNPKYRLETVTCPIGLPTEVSDLEKRIRRLAVALEVAPKRRVVHRYTPPRIEDLPSPPGVVTSPRQLVHPAEETIEVVGPQASWYEDLLALGAKAEMILVETEKAAGVAEGGSEKLGEQSGQADQREVQKRRPRVKREAVEPLILDHLNRRPHDTAGEVGDAVGCSVGVVAESSAWKANQQRLKIAKGEGKDPKAVKLDPKAFTEAGGNWGAQRHETERQQQALDNEIDQRDRELFNRIGEYKKEHPDATCQEVAQTVGCLAGDVERREAMLKRLAAEHDASAKEDAGGRLLDEDEPGVDLARPRQWVRKLP